MFTDFSLDRRLYLGLESMGLAEPTEVQREVMPAALQGRNLSVSAETGSGKTLAYLIPTVQHLLASTSGHTGTQALVLVPTRELARQVLQQARKLTAKTPIDVQAITGGADFRFQASIFRKDPQLVIATPGRLLEHCEKCSADLSSLKILVLDEADRMLDMGFRDDVLSINGYSQDDKQVVMISATLQHEKLGTIANALLVNPTTINIGQVRQAHSSIYHQMILADGPDHKDKLLLALLSKGGYRRALVFSNKRTTAMRLAGLMSYHKLRCIALHGEMTTEQRKAAMVQFREGKLDIVSASDLAARGLDVADIDLVINYDMPRKGDDYLHRTGRTGRAGAEGLAISLVDHSEWNLMAAIARYLKIDFERRSLPGLKAKYTGPKNTKSSGKAAGTKKKRSRTPADKSKSRHRNQKSRGKRSPASPKPLLSNDGTSPLMKKKKEED